MLLSDNCASACAKQHPVTAGRADARGRYVPAARPVVTRHSRAAIVAFSLGASLLVAPAGLFAQFSPGPNPIPNGTTTGAQTLSAGTGTVDAGGAIKITSGGTVPLTMTGTSTLNNNGTIQTLGTGRAIDSNSGIANLTITNTGLISSVSTDAFRVNTNSVVLLTNSGTIQVTAGGQAIDWAAITSASNKLVNQSGGSITAVGEDAVRPGNGGIIENAGTISATPTGTTSPSGSDGIDLRTEKTVIVTNTGTISGRHGIATDGANAGPSSLTVNNNAGTISALNGSGLNVDGVNTTVTANVTNAAGATIKGGVTAAATNGDGDGVDIDGVLTLNNSGDILGLGAKGVGSDGLANNAQAVSIGGGTINNFATGKIVGSTLASDAPNGDPNRAGEGILADNSSGGNSIAETTITNDGLIQGKTGAAIRLVSTFSDKVTNNTGGKIQGAGTGAAVQTGNGSNTLTNWGEIIGDNGSAVDLQGGDDVLELRGSAASIVGNISGGAGDNTLLVDLGIGNSFVYGSGLISNFSTLELVSGLFTLDGANLISSTTVLDLNGGALKVANVGAPNGQTFESLFLSNNSTIDLDPTSLTFNALGDIVDDKTLTILNYDFGTSPDYAIRLLGDYTFNARFLELMANTTINSVGTYYSFDGTYTNVTAAVPEPGSLAIFGISTLGVCLFGRRRRV